MHGGLEFGAPGPGAPVQPGTWVTLLTGHMGDTGRSVPSRGVRGAEPGRSPRDRLGLHRASGVAVRPADGVLEVHHLCEVEMPSSAGPAVLDSAVLAPALPTSDRPPARRHLHDRALGLAVERADVGPLAGQEDSGYGRGAHDGCLVRDVDSPSLASSFGAHQPITRAPSNRHPTHRSGIDPGPRGSAQGAGEPYFRATRIQGNGRGRWGMLEALRSSPRAPDAPRAGLPDDGARLLVASSSRAGRSDGPSVVVARFGRTLGLHQRRDQQVSHPDSGARGFGVPVP